MLYSYVFIDFLVIKFSVCLLKVTGANASALSSAHNKLETEYGPLKDALNISRELVANAMAHAVNLTAQADYLER